MTFARAALLTLATAAGLAAAGIYGALFWLAVRAAL